MAEARERLSQEGFTDQEVREVLRRASELQHQATHEEGQMSQIALEAGAEAAGIPSEIVEHAIQELKAEREREIVRRSARRRALTRVGGVAGVVFLITAFFSHLSLNARLAEVEEKRTQLENVLQRRHDLIPNLIAVAKAYATHETELVASLDEVYQRLDKAQEFQQRQVLEQELSERAQALMAGIRLDPKASTIALFVRLSDEMAGAENRIAVERKRYNEAVVAYNRTARGFPVFLVRPSLGFPGIVPAFQASDDAKKPPHF